ncbi:MAG: transcription-repair coupling factor, partial [Spirochaetaceae bacterium]|nr:transcription-repair coupling factor [Spirochaetaceae bacterium]
MNTLSFPAFLDTLRTSPDVTGVFAACKKGAFPLELEGCEGAFTALLLGLLSRSLPGRLLAVTPTDREAEELASDLETLGVESDIFPWWGAMPYREMAPLSAVFGERTRVLASLAGGGRGVVIAPERAFLTPLPPPEYIRRLLVTLRPGGKIDTPRLAETLVGYGYTRTPRVQVHGEFTLRGEVLDILLGGEEEAYRVLFDFDRVESIKRFDPRDQSGHELVDALVLRPVKEVVWSDDRIEALSRNLSALEEFPGKGRVFLEDLMTRRETGGEELLFPLAFDSPESPPAVLLDYLDPNGTVCYIDRERLENAQEALEREYEGLYRAALREASGRPAAPTAAGTRAGTGKAANAAPIRELPAPRRILLKFKDLAPRIPRRISFMTIKGGGEAGATRLEVACDPPRSFFGNINYLKEEFDSLIKQGWRIIIAAES